MLVFFFTLKVHFIIVEEKGTDPLERISEWPPRIIIFFINKNKHLILENGKKIENRIRTVIMITKLTKLIIITCT